MINVPRESGETTGTYPAATTAQNLPNVFPVSSEVEDDHYIPFHAV